MATFLPAPKHVYQVHPEGAAAAAAAGLGPSRALTTTGAAKKKVIPPYGQRKRFVPRSLEDFGDGGAFPEIHVAQYPLNMGRPGASGGGGGGGAAGVSGSSGGNSSALVAVDVDESGKVKYDAIVRQGTNADRIVYTQLANIKEKPGDAAALAAPTEDEELSAAARTAAALEKIVGAKVAAATPGMIPMPASKEPEYVRYTPNPNAPGFNPAAKQRVVRLVEAQVDPMEPPKHRFKKVPRGPSEAPVPVLHSPPRKVTVQDQQAWKIPPCVSNWKNARGYTIPLDKRLAADGRGLQEVTVSHNFASLAEALYSAEGKAREETVLRSEMTKHIALKEKAQKEVELRELAARARMERAGVAAGAGGGAADADAAGGRAGGGGVLRGDAPGAVGGGETEAERVAAQQRDKLRAERKREREREMRVENMKGNMKKARGDRERDVSEQVALGQFKATGRGEGGGYDARLFNQSAGMDAGFGGEDEYNVYTKAMFDRGEAQSIYRPRASADDVAGGADADEQLRQLSSTQKFRPDRGFVGTEGAPAAGTGGARQPVQFERTQEEADPFGLDSFLREAKKGKGGGDKDRDRDGRR